MLPLDVLFRPRSVAVVGASRNPRSLGWAVVHNLVRDGFVGPVYPVNPKADAVHSLPAWPTLASIPGPVDLAVITVPSSLVLAAVDDAARKGVRALVTITAGFKEIGGDGVALEEELRRRVRDAGIRMVGPNCMGLINMDPEVRLNASFAAGCPPVGNVAFASQSGALGEAILDTAAELGLGLSSFVSLGNKTDVSGNDLLEHWGQDPATRLVLLYLESFGNPRRFARLAREVTRERGKPILAVKSGRTRSGAAAASSHTGGLAGTEAAVKSMFEQCGIVRADTVRDLFDMAQGFASQPIPAGRRLAILTNAGGPAIMATDAAVHYGLELPELAPATLDAMAAVLPPEASLANPVDMIASADGPKFQACAEALLADPNIDALLAIFVAPSVIDATDVAESIVRGVAAGRARGGDKPVLCTFMRSGTREGIDRLTAAGLPVYRFPEAAARALGAMARFGEYRRRPSGTVPTFDPPVAAQAAHGILDRAGPGWLRFPDVMALLGAYGVPVVPWRAVDDAAGAIEFGQEHGWPIVLKIDSDTVLHRSEHGGVQVDLRSPEDVERAAAAIAENMADLPGDHRLIAQTMLDGGSETLIGATVDPAFGPLIAFGLGGIHVELMKDVVFRLAPLSVEDGDAMVRGIKGFPLLQGARGRAPVQLAALQDVLLRVGRLVTDHPRIVELDLNPFFAHPAAGRQGAADARVRVA